MAIMARTLNKLNFMLFMSIPYATSVATERRIVALAYAQGSHSRERPSTMTVKGRFGKYAILQTQQHQAKKDDPQTAAHLNSQSDRPDLGGEQRSRQLPSCHGSNRSRRSGPSGWPSSALGVRRS